MLSDSQLRKLGEIYQQRMMDVSAQYFEKMGKHLKEVGALSPADVHRLTELRRAGANVEAIQRAIADAAGRTAREIETLFMRVAEEDYRFAAQYYVKGRQIPIRKNLALLRIIKAQARQTAAELHNLSQTTIESGLYKKAVDKAVQAVQSGVADYQSAIRQTIRQAGQEGLRVKYPNSGLTRRLDTAARQNVLDGARQLQAHIMEQVGKEFGADGVEISAHLTCAPDHLPYQGLQFTYKQFERLQQVELARPIGQWNCRHFVSPVIVGISPPTHTQEQLDHYKRYNEERITIDGITKTRYEWTQEQRKLESAIRERKDVANLAKASGDDILRRETQAHINKLDAVYGRISEGAGLYSQRERMSVAEFRRVKTIDQLKHPEKYGIISLDQRKDDARTLIRSDAISKKVNAGHQNKHLLYSDHYIEGRSYVYGTIDHAQAIVDKYHGSGEFYFSRKSGKWNGHEVITADHDIGVDVDQETGVGVSTNRATIHYGKRGTHVVPTRRKEP